MHKLFYASRSVDCITCVHFYFVIKCFIICINLYSFCHLYLLSFMYMSCHSFHIKGTPLVVIDTILILRLTRLVHSITYYHCRYYIFYYIIIIIIIYVIIQVFVEIKLYKNFTLLHIYIL